MKVLATIGYFDASGEGRLLEVDLATGALATRLRHIPAPDLNVPSKGFTGACWLGKPGASDLAICGHSALYRVSPHTWTVETTWHQPCMNDLHHVATWNERVFLVNTGLESVDVFSMDGSFVGSHALHPGWFSAARQAGALLSREGLAHTLNCAHTPARTPQPSPLALESLAIPSHSNCSSSDAPGVAGYYQAAASLPFHQRKVRDFYHPNHICPTGQQLLVTRLLDSSVWDLIEFRPIIEQTPGLPHDGILQDDRFWLTCVNGLVVAYAVENGRVTGREVERLDVFEKTGRSGWCRGLLIERDFVVVGLTELRPGRMPRQRWCDRPFEGTETSLLCLERRTGRLVARVNLTDPTRHSKVFSVLSCT